MVLVLNQVPCRNEPTRDGGALMCEDSGSPVSYVRSVTDAE